MNSTTEQTIVKLIDNFRAAMTFVFVGAMILSQGIHAISELLVKRNVDYYAFAILFIGLCAILYGELLFYKAKKKMLTIITLVSKETEE